jgi:hypothetical protein
MGKINLDGRTFGLLANSENGEVSGETLFYYQQEDDLVSAEYYGGRIRSGKIIARQMANNDLQMLYQCLTFAGELKAGSARAKVSINGDNKIQLDLNWSWLNGDKTSGTSTYVEIDNL